jgi:YidC/Oxa1 family membrane protein insertase
MDKKTILAIVLSFLVVLGYNYFFVKPQQDARQQARQQSQEQAAPAAPEQGVKTADKPAPAEAPAAKQPKAEAKKQVPPRSITIDSPLYTAVFNTQGAVLTSFKLKKYDRTLDANSGLVEMVDVQEGMQYPLVVTFPDSSLDVSPADIYESKTTSLSLDDVTGPKQMVLSWTGPAGVRVEKAFTFYPDKYQIDLEVRVVNSSSNNLAQKALLAWNEYRDPKAEDDSYGRTGPIYFSKKDVETPEVKKLESRKFVGTDISWAGYESKYFIAAMIPKQPSVTGLVMGKNGDSMVTVALEGPKNTVPPGQTTAFNYDLYLGPKDYEVLKAVSVGLENSIDFGSWIKWLALPLLLVLKFLYKFVLNYGVAIIIITIVIKIIFWPLGNKSYKSMKEMQKLQPLMNELREKYKNDKARLNQEVMQLYKTHKVNPMGGCLPMLIQIPVFFGLYKALLYSIELRHAPFLFWIQDLSAKDPYYITPIIMGATMFWQQKMTPTVGDPMQAKLMLLMPVVFTFLFLNFPSGLVIYWLFNNILSIGQQYYVNKTIA